MTNHNLNKAEIEFLASFGLDANSPDIINNIKNILQNHEIELFSDVDNGGISKNQNWQGGGEFIYFELKKYNEIFIEKIIAANNTSELLEIWAEMKEKSFLNYNIDIKKQDQYLKSFSALPFAKQQQHLLEILDKNQLYVNISSLEDADFACNEDEKLITKDFYKTNQQ